MDKGALFSYDKKSRHVLWRNWNLDLPKVMFIGLNPSTANETNDDQTIKRCIAFAKSWGFGGMIMMNLYSHVSTNPDDLITSGENLEQTNEWLLERASKCEKVVFACGAFKKHKQRLEQVLELFPERYCIDISKDGFPKHPCRLNGSLKLKKYPGFINQNSEQ